MLKMLEMMKLADYFTIGNFVSGVLSIFLSLNGNIKLAAILILVGVVFDYFDGKIARWTKTSNALGKQLDSLADSTTFGVAPVIMGYSAGLDTPIGVIALVFYSVCGMLRLARFNVSDVKGFIGVPITVGGLVIPLIYLGHMYVHKSPGEYIAIIYAVFGFLMISDFKVKKL